MSLLQRTIFTGFSPNSTGTHVKIALSYLFLPWKWFSLRKGEALEETKQKILDYFSTPHAVLFDSGRSALFFALKALGVGEGDRVLVQAYTCVVVINAIRWVGAEPVFVDIRDDYTMDPNDLKQKINQKAKTLIIQHTFGQPAALDALCMIAKEHRLSIIEDCAHSFGVSYRGQYTGTFGDVGLFSFGSDKSKSCVRGGAVIVRDAALAKKLEEMERGLRPSSWVKIIQHLIHVPVFFVGKATYGFFGFGKALLFLAKFFHMTNRIMYKPEKRGKPVPFYPRQFPNALADLLKGELNTINTVNEKRKKISFIYRAKICNSSVQHPVDDVSFVPLRYTVRTKNPERLRAFAKTYSIILGDWYSQVIAPQTCDLSTFGYTQGECPLAERIAEESVNLPTERHMTEKDIARVVEMMNAYTDHPV